MRRTFSFTHLLNQYLFSNYCVPDLEHLESGQGELPETKLTTRQTTIKKIYIYIKIYVYVCVCMCVYIIYIYIYMIYTVCLAHSRGLYI